MFLVHQDSSVRIDLREGFSFDQLSLRLQLGAQIEDSSGTERKVHKVLKNAVKDDSESDEEEDGLFETCFVSRRLGNKFRNRRKCAAIRSVRMES